MAIIAVWERERVDDEDEEYPGSEAIATFWEFELVDDEDRLRRVTNRELEDVDKGDKGHPRRMVTITVGELEHW